MSNPAIQHLMKIKLIILAFVLFSTQAYSQSKNNISLFYGVAANNVNIHGDIGDYGYKSKSSTIIGFGYTHNLTNSFALETGLQYSSNKLILSYIVPDRGEILSPGRAKLITVPIYGKYTFLKYLYVNAGLLVDFDFGADNDTGINDQKGIGAEIGVGGKYDFGKVTVFINPFLLEHRLIGFKNYGRTNSIENAGVKFGVGYNF
jgi:hypothetical protein